jgi:hypothetical protein
MNTYGGLEAELRLCTFLTPALDEFEWSSPRPPRLTPGDTYSYPNNKRLRGPQMRTACCGKTSQSPAAAETQNHGRQPRSQITIRTKL